MNSRKGDATHAHVFLGPTVVNEERRRSMRNCLTQKNLRFKRRNLQITSVIGKPQVLGGFCCFSLSSIPVSGNVENVLIIKQCETVVHL